jgi:hypothetical protein
MCFVKTGMFKKYRKFGNIDHINPKAIYHDLWVAVALSLGIKRPGREADHSPPSSAEVKECVELYLHFTNTPSWRGA